VILCGVLLAGCEADDPAMGLERFPTQWLTAAIPTLGAPTEAGPVSTAEVPVLATDPPDFTAVPLPVPAITAQAPHSVIGKSVDGLPIEVWQFGSGETHITLVGGIHGGYEFNTVQLAEMLINYFDENPSDVLPGISLAIIPAANPDGVTRGRGLAGRLNAHRVDLNRNWDCEWSDKAVWGTTPVDPGDSPFTEPEAIALRDYLAARPPDAVIFYHSAADLVEAGECNGVSPGKEWLPQLISGATGYPTRRFDAYQVTGDAANWLAKIGVPAVTIELETKNEPEFRRNLAGVIALQCHFALERVADAEHDPSVQRLCL
jgi:hypothetical protein